MFAVLLYVEFRDQLVVKLASRLDQDESIVNGGRYSHRFVPPMDRRIAQSAESYTPNVSFTENKVNSDLHSTLSRTASTDQSDICPWLNLKR